MLGGHVPEADGRARRLLWSEDHPSTPPMRVLVAVEAAFFAFRSGTGASLWDLLRARVRALFRRHASLAVRRTDRALCDGLMGLCGGDDDEPRLVGVWRSPL